ncbi:MAG: sigma-70 family RNA polymerase sigma factor [Planctomycetes bacterium]|nr:sigma-70 family RNA polymerase sigma factor [Planctomycetota bacterium]
MIVERYQQRIFQLLYGIVRDRHEIEDVAQEVFLKVYERIGSFDGRSQFYTWLYRVAANAAKDHIKKRARRPAVALEQEALVAADERGPEESAAAEETRLFVRRAIDALPPRYREILTLRELEGMSYVRIAEVLSISIGTVESRIFRARERLKRRLKHHVE